MAGSVGALGESDQGRSLEPQQPIRGRLRDQCVACSQMGPDPSAVSGQPKTAWLTRTKAPGFPHDAHAGPLAEFRLTESTLRIRGLWPLSTWGLFRGTECLSQSLVGIPVLHRLLTHPELSERSTVWPMSTSLTADPTSGRRDAIVHAAVAGVTPIDWSLHTVRDAAQVEGLVGISLASTGRAGSRISCSRSKAPAWSRGS